MSSMFNTTSSALGYLWDTTSPFISVKTIPLIIILAFLCVAWSVHLYISQSKRGDTILLVGPSESGKTAILSELVHGQAVPTHTSLQTNVSFMKIPGKKTPVKLVDVPGHPRIRDQFREHMSEARAIVFVVDANSISRNGAAVAEHLHLIMSAISAIPPSQLTPTLVILAHKTDLVKASSTFEASPLAVDRVQKVLERELEKRRLALSSGMAVETLDSENEILNIDVFETDGPTDVFHFENWGVAEAVFLGTSTRPSEKDITVGMQSFHEWLESHSRL